MGKQVKTLRFKESQKLYQYMDQTGFMWLNGHEKEMDVESADFLLKHFSDNFTEVVSVEKQDDDQREDESVEFVAEEATATELVKKLKEMGVNFYNMKPVVALLGKKMLLAIYSEEAKKKDDQE